MTTLPWMPEPATVIDGGIRFQRNPFAVTRVPERIVASKALLRASPGHITSLRCAPDDAIRLKAADILDYLGVIVVGVSFADIAGTAVTLKTANDDDGEDEPKSAAPQSRRIDPDEIEI